MSRNYDLIREAEKEQECFQGIPSSGSPGDGITPQPNILRLTQEEEIRLVQRVFLSSDQHSPRFVVFGGVEQGNGCSRVCARAAEILAAQVEGSVCVVDANFRSPSLHRYFGINNQGGLADALTQGKSIRDSAHHVARCGLWVVPSGAFVPEAPYPRLISTRLQSCVTQLRAEFDYVLMDVPPANLSAGSLSFTRLADGMVLVVEANSTRRGAAQEAKESLQAAGIHLLGVVLNKRTFPIPEVLYRKL